MKSIKVAQNIGYSFVIMASVLFLSGCIGSTQQIYSGASVPQEKSALIKIANNFLQVTQDYTVVGSLDYLAGISNGHPLIGIIAVDGVKLPQRSNEVTLVPGKHTITFSAKVACHYYMRDVPNTSADVFVAAGGIYKAYPNLTERDLVSVNIYRTN